MSTVVTISTAGLNIKEADISHTLFRVILTTNYDNFPYSISWLALIWQTEYCIFCGTSAEFFGAFANLRKATISFVMSVRPSHATIRLSLDGFS